MEFKVKKFERNKEYYLFIKVERNKKKVELI